jgi:NADP-dependent 3-hydroxy acid dehydrogenase YdfG
MPTVAITGSAGAIGSTTADVFADAGWTLALIDHDAEQVAQQEAQYDDAHAFDCDLTDADATRDTFDAIANATGGINAVLGIAGGFAMQAAAEASSGDYAHMMDLNVRTLFNTTRAALPHLTTQDDSFLLGVSAPGALEGQAQAGLYAASKAAVAAYLKSVAIEHEDDGLRVSVLYPMGVVDTPANREAMPDADFDGWVTPAELADHMLHLATRSPQGHVKELQVHATA